MRTRHDQIRDLIEHLFTATRLGNADWETTDSPTTLRLERDSGTVLLHRGNPLMGSLGGTEIRFLDRSGDEKLRYQEGLNAAISGYQQVLPHGQLEELYDLAFEQCNSPVPNIDSFIDEL